MKETTTADAVIMGAGTIGTATAWHLAQMGLKKIILVERNGIGTGSTSKAASLMTLARTKESLIPLIQETYRNIDTIESITGESVQKKQVGTIHIAASEKTLDNLKEIISIANKHSIPNRAITAEEVSKKAPWINSDKIINASYMPEDSFVDAYLLTNTFALAAKKSGVVIKRNTIIEKLLFKNRSITGIKISSGDIHTPVVVDAAGAWSNVLSLQAGIPIPMAPVRSIYWITEKNEKLFPKSHPMIVLPDAMIYSRPESGRLLFGLREENSPHFHPFELNPKPNTQFLGPIEDKWDILIDYKSQFNDYFPAFYDIGVQHCITGISTYTPDGYYTLGPIGGFEGFYAATGCAGAGVAGSGGIGRLVAEMVAGKPTFANALPFKIDRFKDFDPMSKSFRKRCADTRGKKKDGG